MTVRNRTIETLQELKRHAPFTMFGALVGIICMLVFEKSGKPNANLLFSVFHPTHVLLSALVTAAMFKIHSEKHKSILLILLMGYIGSIGIATLSDSVMPWFGEKAFGLHIPKHEHNNQEMHLEHDSEPAHDEHQSADVNHKPQPELHLGFIKEWYFVHPAAILGALIGFYLPKTRFPHAGHILISTWATSSHIFMNLADSLSVRSVAEVFVILFLAVWLPCCVSDIIFPVFFARNKNVPLHELHSH